MALNSLLCAHVPLRNCSLTHSLSFFSSSLRNWLWLRHQKDVVYVKCDVNCETSTHFNSIHFPAIDSPLIPQLKMLLFLLRPNWRWHRLYVLLQTLTSHFFCLADQESVTLVGLGRCSDFLSGFGTVVPLIWTVLFWNRWRRKAQGETGRLRFTSKMSLS